MAGLIRCTNYLVLTKTDLDFYFYNTLLEKTTDYILRPSANLKQSEKGKFMATQLLQGEKRYYLINITRATCHLKAHATILSLTFNLKILD